MQTAISNSYKQHHVHMALLVTHTYTSTCNIMLHNIAALNLTMHSVKPYMIMTLLIQHAVVHYFQHAGNSL